MKRRFAATQRSLEPRGTAFPAGKSNLTGKEKGALDETVSLGRSLSRIGLICGVLAMAVVMLVMPLGSVAAETVEPVVEVLPAAFTDVPRGEHFPIFNYLGGLRILSGDRGLGGPVRPQEPLTRVEFTAVMIRLAGKQNVAQSFMNGVPEFTDGPDIPRWAWGMVTTARDMGLIRGYPDGTFRPYNTVTQGEALTMLARLLEWEPAQWGDWDGYVGRAVQGGLAGRLRLDLIEEAPAYKHEVAHMAYMALEASPDDSTETLFDRQFTSVRGVFGSYDLSEGTAILGGRQYDLAARVVLAAGNSLGDLTGHPVSAVLDSEGRILFLNPLVGP